MKKTFLAMAAALALVACSQIPGTGASKQVSPSPSVSPSPEATDEPAATTPPPAGSYSLTFSFTGPSVHPHTVYCVWIEDESGTNLQNIYICNTMENEILDDPNRTRLTGDALPNWIKKKYPQHTDIDGVTGVSIQGDSDNTVTRSLNLGTARRFKVLFDIDRSTNGNYYFTDRPAFTYSTEVIDLDHLQAEYPLTLIGWMANNTDDPSFGQQPKNPVASFQQYVFNTDIIYIEDEHGSTADMVTEAKAVVVKN